MSPRLTAFERGWMDAASDAIFPEQTSLPHGIARMAPATYLDDILREVPLEQAFGLRLTLWVIGLAPLFMIRRFGTIASIAPSDRVRVLEALLATPIYVLRQLAMSFKAVVTLRYVESPEVRRAMSVSTRTVKDELVSGSRLIAGRRVAA